MAKILLVEDDADLADSLLTMLELENHRVELVDTGEDALQMLGNYRYDVIILDWGLPGITGMEVLRKYRNSGGLIPVILLTGRGDLESKTSGLDSGADDYVTKPFAPKELSARIRTLLRRPIGLIPKKLSIANVTIEIETRNVFLNNVQVRLTNKEYAVLEFLMCHPNQIFSARSLMEAIWPSDTESSEDTVRSCVKNLRKKISIDGQEGIGIECIVKTIHGSGYIVEAEPSQAE